MRSGMIDDSRIFSPKKRDLLWNYITSVINAIDNKRREIKALCVKNRKFAIPILSFLFLSIGIISIIIFRNTIKKGDLEE